MKNKQKQLYEAPTLKEVSFRVERGFALSATQMTQETIQWQQFQENEEYRIEHMEDQSTTGWF